MFTKTKIVLSLLFASLAFAPMAFAATLTGSGIAGQVTCSGATNVSAVVEVEKPNGNRVYANTDANGFYSFRLGPGNYYIAISSITNCLAPISLFFPTTVYPNAYTIVNFNF